MSAHNSDSAIKQGLKVGVFLAIVSALVTVLYDTGVFPSGVQAGEFIVILIGLFDAGRRTAQQTGRVGTGSIAGVIASLLPALIILGANVVLVLVSPTTIAKAYGWHDTTSGQLLTAILIQSFVGLLLWLALGAGVGALGGLAGRRRSVSQTVESVVSTQSK